jgi:hypothetical protein
MGTTSMRCECECECEGAFLGEAAGRGGGECECDAGDTPNTQRQVRGKLAVRASGTL